jgi:hypothetical protein
VVKAPVIELYAVPAAVKYLQVAGSLVTRDMVAWVVPAARVPEGWELDCTGGVVSIATEDNVLLVAILDKGEMLFASSIDLIAK